MVKMRIALAGSDVDVVAALRRRIRGLSGAVPSEAAAAPERAPVRISPEPDVTELAAPAQLLPVQQPAAVPWTETLDGDPGRRSRGPGGARPGPGGSEARAFTAARCPFGQPLTGSANMPFS